MGPSEVSEVSEGLGYYYYDNLRYIPHSWLIALKIRKFEAIDAKGKRGRQSCVDLLRKIYIVPCQNNLVY